MKTTRNLIAFVAIAFASFTSIQAQDPLPSWNDGPVKKSIIEFVTKVTNEGTPDYVPPAERIATFDNDGTLWCEQPMPVQLFFALDRVKALAPQHPEWKDTEPFASLLKGDLKTALGSGEHAVIQIIAATHAGMTTEEFEQIVKDWIAAAKHPKYQQPFTDCVYQPMIEVLDYFRANGFKTYIVSGGGIEFMRPWTRKTYGISPQEVVGSSGKVQYQIRDGKAVLVKLPAIDFVDDKAGKPVGINEHIGRRPIAAFGNSTGDQQMLEYAQSGGGLRLMVLVHHDDAEREYAYGTDSKIGTFTDALMAEAKEKKWNVISMKDDWKKVFKFEN